MTLVVILDVPMKSQAVSLSTTTTAGTLPTKLLHSLKSWKNAYISVISMSFQNIQIFFGEK